MALSTLADAIDQQLRSRVPQSNAEACKITYKDLVERLPPLERPFADLHWRDPRLDEALGELVSACRAKGLPAISAIVVNGETRQPGRRYYEVAHPGAGQPLEQGDRLGQRVEAGRANDLSAGALNRDEVPACWKNR